MFGVLPRATLVLRLELEPSAAGLPLPDLSFRPFNRSLLLIGAPSFFEVFGWSHRRLLVTSRLPM